jgi:hypothetical protein
VTDADAELFEVAATMIVVTVASHAIFAWDERRMTDAQKERAWPASTRGVVTVSPLFFPLWLVGVPLHFVRTRRSLRGVGEGLVALLAVYLAAAIADGAVALVTGTG